MQPVLPAGPYPAAGWDIWSLGVTLIHAVAGGVLWRIHRGSAFWVIRVAALTAQNIEHRHLRREKELVALPAILDNVAKEAVRVALATPSPTDTAHAPTQCCALLSPHLPKDIYQSSFSWLDIDRI